MEHNLELLVVLGFELVELLSQIGMSGEKLTETNEGTHDFDVDSDRPGTPQNAGEHVDAWSSDNVGQVSYGPGM